MIKRFIVGILILATTSLVAQQSSASPYSYFGVGEDAKALTAEQASMGGIGVALKDTHHLNFLNPAANANLRYATYSIGGRLTFLTLDGSNGSDSGNTSSLQYIALGFPIGKKAGFSAGLQPYSSSGYNISNTTLNDAGDITEIERFKGSGGVNKLYASFGMQILEGFSIGAEAGFLFGTLENSILQDTGVMLSTRQEETLKIRGGEFKFGAQYQKKLKGDLELYTGGTLVLESDLSIDGTNRVYSLTFGTSGVELERKELFNKTTSGNITMPVKTIFGVGLGKENKWYIGINQEYKKAIVSSGNFNTEAGNYQYESGRKLAIGGFYIPKINSISSYWDRVTYRAGIRFEKVGLLVDGTGNGENLNSIDDFGINIGFGLPLPKQLSNLNIGLEYGQKGTLNNNLVKEKYFNIRLGLSLNSLNWFKKRKID